MVQVKSSAVTPRLALFFTAALLFFFVSGACGLLYQVVWTRQLALLFGATSHAVSVVLSIFFLGLGAGSLWGGRLADRVRTPLAWYGFFEILIGLWAAALVALLAWGEDVAVALLQLVSGARAAGIAVRALLALCLLFPPVFLMGATLPLLSRQVTHATHLAGRQVGLLYSVNTFGAVAGCALAGFVLIEQWGYTRATLAGALANAVVGVLSIAVARWTPLGEAAPLKDTVEAETPPAPGASPWLPRLVLAGFTLSGFCSLGLEVIWTRLLSIIFLGTTYAYTTMLVVLLCGIALGGLAGAFIADRARRPAAWFAGVLLFTGVLALGQLSGFAALPEAVVAASGSGWEGETRLKFLLAARVLFPPTLLLGATFVFAVKALAHYRHLGRHVGRIYAFNTFGGVAGSAAGGFLLLPLLGSHLAIVTLALALCAMGALLMLASGAPRRLQAAALLAAAVWGGIAMARAPGDVNAALNVGYVPERHEVLAVREGVEGTVVVSQPRDEPGGSNRVLWINRVQATASIERGVRMNRLQGALPHLFNRDAGEVLFMCFGSGVTCGTLALGGFGHIDAVEISPDVLAVAPLFEADNLGVLGREGIDFHIDDGRNFLLVNERPYDFITFEPMPLALSGVSSFYTREYYAECLAHLKPGGMVSQWVPLHSLNPDIVRSLAATYVEVFPHVCAWFINADLFLIGSNEPLWLDPAAAEKRLGNPELRGALEAAGFHDLEELYACFIMDDAALRAFAEGGTPMTDDRPWAEFIAPKLVYERTVQQSLELLQRHAASPLPLLVPGTDPALAARIERRHRARLHDFEGLIVYYGDPVIGSEAFDAFDRSLDIDPAHFNSRYYMKQIALQQSERYIAWEMWEEAAHLLGRSLHRMPDDPELRARNKALEQAMREADADPRPAP